MKGDRVKCELFLIRPFIIEWTRNKASSVLTLAFFFCTPCLSDGLMNNVCQNYLD